MEILLALFLVPFTCWVITFSNATLWGSVWLKVAWFLYGVSGKIISVFENLEKSMALIHIKKDGQTMLTVFLKLDFDTNLDCNARLVLTRASIPEVVVLTSICATQTAKACYFRKTCFTARTLKLALGNRNCKWFSAARIGLKNLNLGDWVKNHYRKFKKVEEKRVGKPSFLKCF